MLFRSNREAKKKGFHALLGPLDDPEAPQEAPRAPQDDNERPKTICFLLVFDRFSTRCLFVIKVARAKGWIAPKSEEKSAGNG